MKVVGLTGGIGSGKTTVAQFFKELGVPVYTADDAAKKLMRQNPIKEEIIEEFGEGSYDDHGELNRKFLASEVFNDKSRLEKLNKIVHPRVRAHLRQWIKAQDTAYVLYEAAILFEAQNHQNLVDHTILVKAPKAVRIERLKKRDNASEEEIEARMENQWSDARKAELADWVIVNTDLKKTQEKVVKIHRILENL